MKTTFKAIAIVLFCLTIGGCQTAPVAESKDSVLVQMLKWWNQAYLNEQAFTEEGFAQYFTDDIIFELNGKRSPKGIKALTERFNKIKDTYYIIEILLPMKEEFRSGNRIFTYHLNRGQTRKGDSWGATSHIMGYVDIKDGKIDFLSFANYDEEVEVEVKKE